MVMRPWVRFSEGAKKCYTWVMAVCAVTDDPKMVKTLFAPEGNGNERNLVVGEAAVVGSSLCRLVLQMSQLILGVAVAQSETGLPPSAARSSPPSPRSTGVWLLSNYSFILLLPFLSLHLHFYFVSMFQH